jgi:hypothetical protein
MFDVVVTNVVAKVGWIAIVLIFLLILHILFNDITFELLEGIEGSMFSVFIVLFGDGRLRRQWLNEDGRFPKRCIIEGVIVDMEDDD